MSLPPDFLDPATNPIHQHLVGQDGLEPLLAFRCIVAPLRDRALPVERDGRHGRDMVDEGSPDPFRQGVGVREEHGHVLVNVEHVPLGEAGEIAAQVVRRVNASLERCRGWGWHGKPGAGQAEDQGEGTEEEEAPARQPCGAVAEEQSSLPPLGPTEEQDDGGCDEHRDGCRGGDENQ
ncbi:MAG: hypothetical protein M5U01_23630 [Ardenticatenaceae bacterium]|nr:hypothetical protein [Ardenticatenaceae bacterium]HBY98966.1 hypothetical protein [Chloroflexota bacterium]